MHSDRGTTSWGPALAGLGVLLGFGFAATATASALFACFSDTSYCTETSEKNGAYVGTLVLPDGEPYRSAEFEVAFATRDRVELSNVPFSTDGEGRFCVLWPQEQVVPQVTPNLQIKEARPADGLQTWISREQIPAGTTCEDSDEGVPWLKAEDRLSSWQFLVPVGVALVGAYCLWLTIGRRPIGGPWLRGLGAVLVLSAATVMVGHWAGLFIL